MMILKMKLKKRIILEIQKKSEYFWLIWNYFIWNFLIFQLAFIMRIEFINTMNAKQKKINQNTLIFTQLVINKFICVFIKKMNVYEQKKMILNINIHLFNLFFMKKLIKRIRKNELKFKMADYWNILVESLLVLLIMEIRI